MRSVGVAVSRIGRHHRCRVLKPNGRLSRPHSCDRRRFLTPRGKRRWRLRLPRNLRPGHYEVRSRAIDAAGNLELALNDASRVRFRIR